MIKFVFSLVAAGCFTQRTGAKRYLDLVTNLFVLIMQGQVGALKTSLPYQEIKCQEQYALLNFFFLFC